MGFGNYGDQNFLWDGLQVRYLKGDEVRAGTPLPFPGHKTSFLLLRSGTLKIQEMDREVALHADRALLCHMWLHCRVLEARGKVIMIVVSFDREFALRHTRNDLRSLFFALLLAEKLPVLTLGYGRRYSMLVLFSRFAVLGEMGSGSPRFVTLLLEAFDQLARALLDMYAPYLKEPYKGQHLPNYSLVLRFLQLVERNCTRRHGVQWYAQALCISSHRLYMEIHAVKGKTVKDCINESLLQKCRKLFQDGKAIGSIAEELGFGTQQAFTRFIKKHTSYTPTKYREQLKKEWDKD
tara:strand:- start:46151 stop:47032 length:882 start_codon:yes stop_codon:yes gene_type:complete